MPTAPCRSTRTVFSCGSLIGNLPSALLLGAEERRSPGLDDAAHALGAGATGAGFALAAVDCPAVLEVAELAIGLDIVAQRRAAGLDRLGKHRFDGGGKLVGAATRHGGGEPARRKPGTIERLADIDVAEPGDDALVKQCRLDRGHLAVELGGQVVTIETRLQWFRA